MAPAPSDAVQPRVLFVAAMGGLGGPVRRLATLLRNLDGVEKVLIKPVSPDLDRQLQEAGATDEHIGLRRTAQRSHMGALFLAVAVFRRSVSRTRPIDVIHANGLVEFALCWPAALLLRKPVVTWVGNYEPPALLKRFSFFLRPVARRTKWNAVSAFAAAVVEEAGLVASSRVTVVSNIIDPKDVAPPADAGRPTDGVVRVGYLQVDRWEKGFDLLPDIVEALADHAGAWKLLLYTVRRQNPAWDRLLMYAPEFVEVRPRTAEVGEIYAECDVVLSPSRRESFNRVVAEALTTGTPVVASELPPVREVVGDAGLYFPEGDAHCAADCLRSLIGDPSLRETLGRRGVARSTAWHPKPVVKAFRSQYVALSS